MNVSGCSDLDGSERGSEERTGSCRMAPPAGETLTANSSSGNLSELDHSIDHGYSRRGETLSFMRYAMHSRGKNNKIDAGIRKRP